MDKVKLTPTPVLKGGNYTAKQVLEHVYRLVEEEPKRLRMKTWISALMGKREDASFRGEMPACGTVACLAGWVNVSTKSEQHTGAEPALTRLGLSYWDVLTPEKSQLRHDLINLFVYSGKDGKATTLKKLRALINRHAATLETLKVTVPTRAQQRAEAKRGLA